MNTSDRTTAPSDGRQPSSKLVRREPCPKCIAEGRDTAGDNLAVYDDGHTYCYGGHGTISNGSKEEFILEEYTYEYLPWRGVSKETMQFYDVKTKIDREGKPISIGYKYPNGSYKVRDLANKAFYVKGDINKTGLFGRDRFSAGAHKYVTICEGELDALSLHQAIGGPVVSVQSSSTAKRDCTVDYDWLSSFERVYLAFDGDPAGREALRSVAGLFDYNKVFVVQFTRRKDANDHLQNGEADELKKIWWNSKQYLPENIKHTFAEFDEILTEIDPPGIPYPWEGLNKMLYGIRFGETVLITAQHKVGKTEIMHFIEHKILKETDYAVGAFFLEEKHKRHLHALAGIERGCPFHLPDVSSTPAEVSSALKEVVRHDERLHVYTRFGSDDPGVFLDTIRFLATARNCRVIFLDHLSIVLSGLASGKDERKQIDYFSTRLEMLVKELDIALIIVSHVNDEGQTRGSRYPEKVFDVTISARRDLMASDPEERKTVHLDVLFNRPIGSTGPACSLVFDRDNYTFIEKETANENFPPSTHSAGGAKGLAA